MRANLENGSTIEGTKWRDNGFLEGGKNMIKLKFLWYPFTIGSNQLCYQ